MNITEVNIKLVQSPNSRLRAFCTLTLNGEIVVRDVKIIEGIKGPFVAMPSRKLMDRCPNCSSKNHLRALYCNECAARLKPDRAMRDDEGRPRLHVDVAHPINAKARAVLQERVLAAYRQELEHSREDGYQPTLYDPDMDYDEEHHEEPGHHTASESGSQGASAEDEGDEGEEHSGREPSHSRSKGFGEGIV